MFQHRYPVFDADGHAWKDHKRRILTDNAMAFYGLR